MEIIDRLARRRTGTRTMDPKLTMFFVLISTIIALSNLRVDHLARLKDGLSLRRWRKTDPAIG